MVRSPKGKKIFVTTAERDLRFAEGGNFHVMICTALVKLNPGLPWQKLHLTRRRIFLPANWT